MTNSPRRIGCMCEPCGGIGDAEIDDPAPPTPLRLSSASSCSGSSPSGIRFTCRRATTSSLCSSLPSVSPPPLPPTAANTYFLLRCRSTTTSSPSGFVGRKAGRGRAEGAGAGAAAEGEGEDPSESDASAAEAGSSRGGEADAAEAIIAAGGSRGESQARSGGRSVQEGRRSRANEHSTANGAREKSACKAISDEKQRLRDNER